MAASKAYAASAATSVPSGTTKGSPVAGTAADYSQPGQSATLTCSIQNGSSAPTSPCVMVAQVSGDGAVWRDYATVSGDTLAGTLYTFAVRVPPEGKFARWIAYGNSANAVTVTFESLVYSPS